MWKENFTAGDTSTNRYIGGEKFILKLHFNNISNLCTYSIKISFYKIISQTSYSIPSSLVATTILVYLGLELGLSKMVHFYPGHSTACSTPYVPITWNRGSSIIYN